MLRFPRVLSLMFHKPMNLIFPIIRNMYQMLTHLFCTWAVWFAKYAYSIIFRAPTDLMFCLMSIGTTTDVSEANLEAFFLNFLQGTQRKFQSHSTGRESNPVLSWILSWVRFTNAKHRTAAFCLRIWNNLYVKGVRLSRSAYLFEYPMCTVRSLLTTGNGDHNLAFYVFKRLGKWLRKIRENKVVPGKTMMA